MVRITELPDLSRFVKRTGRIDVCNTVHLVVGKMSVEVSGVVMSQASQILQDLVGSQLEVYLDQFEGESEGIQDVVEMLYGGHVELNELNFKTVLKFSVLYDVKAMYTLCLDWVKEHIDNATLDLYSLIQFGLLIQSLEGCGKCDVLDRCTSFIKDHVRDDFLEVSAKWAWSDDLVRYLVQEEIFYYTLPLLTSWIQRDANIRVILTEFESKDLIKSLWSFGVRSSDLLDKMSEKCEMVDTMRSILALQGLNYRECVTLQVDVSQFDIGKDLAKLLSMDYRAFGIDEVMAVEVGYNLTHFEFVEIVLEWIIGNYTAVTQDVLNRLWGSFVEERLDDIYIGSHVPNTILPMKPIQVFENKLAVDEFKYSYQAFRITKGSELKPFKVRKKCKTCSTNHNFDLKLTDATPCFELDLTDSHCDIGHVYLSYQVNKEFICFSLITNSYNSVVQKISECWESNLAVLLVCLHTCGKNSALRGKKSSSAPSLKIPDTPRRKKSVA